MPIDSLEELKREFTILICEDLPIKARRQQWAISAPDEIETLIIAHVFRGTGSAYLSADRPLLDQLDIVQVQQAIDLAKTLLTSDSHMFNWMYAESQRWNNNGQ